MNEIRVLSATGMLGSGFREETMRRGMALEPHFIGVDSGSTDPGPYYLATGDTHFSDSAYKRDWRLILLAARAGKIPAIAGRSSDTSIFSAMSGAGMDRAHHVDRLPLFTGRDHARTELPF